MTTAYSSLPVCRASFQLGRSILQYSHIRTWNRERRNWLFVIKCNYDTFMPINATVDFALTSVCEKNCQSQTVQKVNVTES